MKVNQNEAIVIHTELEAWISWIKKHQWSFLEANKSKPHVNCQLKKQL